MFPLWQDNYPPVSPPLICERDWPAEEIVMSLLQPLTIEAIPRLNSFSSAYTGKIELEYYNVASSEFIAIENIKAH